MRPSVAATLDQAEGRAFVGRQQELGLMGALLQPGVRDPAVLYVHGPAGVGKSALLRAYRRLATSQGATAILLDGGLIEPGREGFLRAIAGAWGRPANPPESILELIGHPHTEAAFVLLVDAYEDLMPLDRWLRTKVFGALGQGAIAVAAGRRPAREIWPADPAWRSLLQRVPLEDLPEPDADDLLARRGVADPALRREAVAMSGGRPLYLVLAAQALSEDGGGTAEPEPRRRPDQTDEHGPTAEMLGLLLHPDAPGRRWTIGPGAAALDHLVGAAALVRAFDQPLLSAMVGGEAAAAGWGPLMQLPVVLPAGGRYALHDAVRSRATELVERERPWLAHAWRQRAIAHHLERVARERGAAAGAWPQLAHLARQSLWHSWLHPDSEEREGWRFDRGVREADYPELARCGDATWRDVMGFGPAALEACHAQLRRMIGMLSAHFVLARDRRGTIIGFHVHAPLTAETLEILTSLMSPGAYLRTLPPALVREWEGRTLCACFVATLDGDAGLHRALLREFCAEFYRYDRVIRVAPAAHASRMEDAVAHLMPMLGFQESLGFQGRHPGVDLPLSAWCLDMAPLGYPEWLRRITAADPGPAGAERVRATREALRAFHDGGALRNSSAARHFGQRFGTPSVELLRAWVLDALADTVRRGGDLVRAYYVDRSGTHEQLAQLHGLPRRTYFDRLLRGIEATADTLFA